MLLQVCSHQAEGAYARVTARQFFLTLYVLTTALSKLVHFHHFCSFVNFGLLEALYLPSLFFADLVLLLLLRLFLADHPREWFKLDSSQPWLITPLAKDKSAAEKSSARNRRRSQSSRTWLDTALFAAGAAASVSSAYFALADVYIYIDFGGLCSWPQVLEVTITPASAAIFVSQWISSAELRALVIIPIATALVAALLCIVPVRRLARKLARFSPLKGTLVSVALDLCLKFVSLPRPYRSVPLLMASCLLWTHILSMAKASVIR